MSTDSPAASAVSHGARSSRGLAGDIASAPATPDLGDGRRCGCAKPDAAVTAADGGCGGEDRLPDDPPALGVAGVCDAVKLRAMAAASPALIGSNLLFFINQTVGMLFVAARLGPVAVGHVGLGMCLVNVTGVSIAIGAACALDTLAPQAFGKDPKGPELARRCQTALVCLMGLVAIIAGGWLASRPVLLWLFGHSGAGAYRYVVCSVPYLLCQTATEVIEKGLIAEQRADVTLRAGIVAFCAAPALNWMFTRPVFGIGGAALAWGLTSAALLSANVLQVWLGGWAVADNAVFAKRAAAAIRRRLAASPWSRGRPGADRGSLFDDDCDATAAGPPAGPQDQTLGERPAPCVSIEGGGAAADGGESLLRRVRWLPSDGRWTGAAEAGEWSADGDVGGDEARDGLVGLPVSAVGLPAGMLAVWRPALTRQRVLQFAAKAAPATAALCGEWWAFELFTAMAAMADRVADERAVARGGVFESPGAGGGVALQAFTVIHAVNFAIFPVALGLAIAVGNFVGEALGALRPWRARNFAVLGWAVAGVGMAVIGVALAVIVDDANALFLGDTGEADPVTGAPAREAATAGSPGGGRVRAALSQHHTAQVALTVLDGWQSMGQGIARGAGMQTFAAVTVLATLWPIAVPAAAYFGVVRGGGVGGLIGALNAGLCVLVPALLVSLWWYRWPALAESAAADLAAEADDAEHD